VAIKNYGGGQFHSGILFKAEDAELMLLHLHSDGSLECELLPQDNYCWVEWPAEEDDRLIFCEWINAVKEANPHGVPFSIIYGGSPHYEADGSHIDARVGAGFTCSSFVMSIFENLGYPLIEFSTWPNDRPEDEAPQQFLVMIASPNVNIPGMTPESIDVQRAAAGMVPRCRPEEIVAAAAIYDGVPKKFLEIEPVGVKLRELLLEVEGFASA
jgi:hypothetical protein